MLQYADWIDEWDQQECVVRKGDTLPGYVGATKTMLNTNVLEEVCFPFSLFVCLLFSF